MIEQSHILLIHHKRIAAWLPPGGHLEDNEFPHQTAIRETKEETGLHINIISLSRLDTKDIEAFFCQNLWPFMQLKRWKQRGSFTI